MYARTWVSFGLTDGCVEQYRAQASRPADGALAWSCVVWQVLELADRGLLCGTERSPCLTRAGTQLLLSPAVVWFPLRSAARSCCEEHLGMALPF